MYCNGVQSYRKTNVTTSDPARLVMLCYEGAIDNLKLAKQKMKEKDLLPPSESTGDKELDKKVIQFKKVEVSIDIVV